MPLLKQLEVSGFKAVDRFSMDVGPELTLLVGMNGAGKSSVLQAFAFARHLAEGNPLNFFDERQWERAALAYRARRRRRGTIVNIALSFESERWGFIRWSVRWGLNGGKLIEETVQLRRSPFGDFVEIYSFTAREGGVIGRNMLPALSFPGSLLEAIQSLDLSEEERGVTGDVLEWLLGIQSLELLSPASMKGGTRLSPGDMGSRGDRLAGFLAALSPEQRSRVVQRVERFYPLADLDTVRKRAGWIDLILTERYEDVGPIRSTQMSDGFMRILALCAIPEFDQGVSLVLLDEIEDGIEPHVLRDLITLVGRETRAQIVATSHSPLLANVVGVENLRFLARTPEGRTVATAAATMPSFRLGSDYFGPGELWTAADMDVLRDEALRRAAENADAESATA